MKQKALRAGDAHSHEDEECRKRPRSARESCSAEASMILAFHLHCTQNEFEPVYLYTRLGIGWLKILEISKAVRGKKRKCDMKNLLDNRVVSGI